MEKINKLLILELLEKHSPKKQQELILNIINLILKKPHGRKEPQKKTILRAMLQGIQISSMWGFKRGIVQTTNRCKELQEFLPIQQQTHKLNGVRFNTYFLPKEYLV